MMDGLDGLLSSKLEARRQAGLHRTLRHSEGRVDFTSNDYLGFARSAEMTECTGLRCADEARSGSGGSRLLSGQSGLAEGLEERIAAFHGSGSALLFNSGYDANVGLFSALGRAVGAVVYDELIHASVHDGMRLSRAECQPFGHNDPGHLAQVLAALGRPAMVAVESIYSMDGDACRLREMAEVCQKAGAYLIVDEAHAIGLFGRNGRGLVCGSGLENACHARLITYGKAMGCHGAAVLSSTVLRDFLVNFARPLIYSTAAPPHALHAIHCAYDLLERREHHTEVLIRLRDALKEGLGRLEVAAPIIGEMAIHGLIVPGNARCREVAAHAWDRGFDVRPIVWPTVPKGSERIRICLHTFNTESEISGLCGAFREALG